MRGRHIKISPLRRNKRPTILQTEAQNRALMKMDNNRKKAFNKFINEHKSKRTIAEEMGTDYATITRWISHEHEKLLAGLGKQAEVVREQQDSQLDQLVERWLPLALHEGLMVRGERFNKKGEREEIELETWDAGTKAADIALKAIQAKAKNHGLHTVEVKRPAPGDPAEGLSNLLDFVMPQLKKLMPPPPKVIEAEIISDA